MSGRGIPHGMRVGLSFRAEFTQAVPGSVEVRFLYENLGPDESFQILVDGYINYFLDGADEPESVAKVHVTPGSHLIEIAVVSSRNTQYLEYSEEEIQDSQAQVFIDRIRVEGTEFGGAS